MKQTTSIVELFASLVIVASFLFGSAAVAQVQNGKKPDTIIATEYPDLNAAVDAAKRLQVGRLFMPAGVYKIKKTLNLSGLPRESQDLIVIEGMGRATQLVADTGKDPVIDMTGSGGLVLRNFDIRTPLKDGKWQPEGSVGILMARNKGNGSAGHHRLEGVAVMGNFSVACVVSYCSEENTYYDCHFLNVGGSTGSVGGDSFVFSGINREGVTSPFHKLGQSTNVVATFYGCWFHAEKKDGVGLRISTASSVYLYSCFFSTYEKAFSAIYLDESSDVRFSSVRQEGSSGHSIYAVGGVSDIMLDSCNLSANDAEAIHYEENVPSFEGPHKFTSKPGTTHLARKAFNWTISGCSLPRVIHADPEVKLDPTKPVPEGLTNLRFESLQESRFQNNVYGGYRVKPGGAISFPPKELISDEPVVVVEKYSRRNYFETPSREAIVLWGDAKANTVVAMADDLDQSVPRLRSLRDAPGRQQHFDGRKRTYVDPDSSGSLMNFGLVNVYKLDRPRKGDVAMHDGTNFADKQARLALFDGVKWVFFKPDAENDRKTKQPH